MNEELKAVAQKCLDGAKNNTMTFPEIVRTLIQNGFESYRIDFLRNTATYYQLDNTSIELLMHHNKIEISQDFNVAAVQSAIKEAQLQVKGYTYKDFCNKIMAAGCIGYIVSFPGKRAVYFGRTAETHVEHFPQ